MLREQFKAEAPSEQSIDAGHGDGTTCKSDEVFVMKTEQRGCIIRPINLIN